MKKWSFKLQIIIVLMICYCSSELYATHLRAGEITAERVDCFSRRFRITITVYLDTESGVKFGGDGWLDLGVGGSKSRILVRDIETTPRPDLGEHMGMATYTYEYDYPGNGDYTISYSERNRNDKIVNISNSVNTKFYIETKISIDPFAGCNNSPKLLVPPIDRACIGATWFHNPGAYDPDGDSLSYEMVIPFQERDLPVIKYRYPDLREYYTNYENAQEDKSGRPEFGINASDGTITWNAPGMAGEYAIAFVIKEWRKINGKWYNVGFVRRDMQIIVEDCDNNRPDLIVPQDFCVVAGTVLNATIEGIDPDGDLVKIEAFSEIFNLAPAQSPATCSPRPFIFQPTSNTKATLTFQWNTDCLHVKDQPYQVVFKITDKSKSGSQLITFKTWFIKVIGPKPEWANAKVDLAKRAANLKWKSYVCQNAKTMQIWRRVDSFAFEPDSCQTGMPGYLGYSLITALPIKDDQNIQATSFTDTNDGRGLAVGAKYCYRLVAIFPSPKGGESYVSQEICIDPILADAPVITNVSVEKTGTSDGRIFVRWMKPFDISKKQFPGPYEYEVYRANDFAGNGNIQKVHTGRKLENDTTLIDAGMNTHDLVFNYRVVLYSNTSQDLLKYSPVDTSSVASTVRLVTKNEFNRINLSWSAFVPWSNLIMSKPNEHLLFRGLPDQDQSQFQQLAEIDPVASGFRYTDDGLSETDKYCYRIMTRGAYGNPQIKEPLENFSQVLCVQASDPVPCKPQLTIQISDCEKFQKTALCNQSSFKNTISWFRTQENCSEDIMGFKIYRASEKDGDFQWLSNAGVNGIVRDTVFVDNGINNAGLSTLAYCYRVSSISWSNKESEMSDPVCNDNCPYYELPNVFTPNGDKCNDVFSAFSDRNFDAGEEADCQPVADSYSRCARFVQKVSFKVYNRWGGLVYDYRSGSERTIYIDWDGRTNSGTELASGVYYYIASVDFDTADPKNRRAILKGWVHLIR